MYKHLLVPVDGTKLSLSALDTAGKLANTLGARVTAVTVSPTYPTLVMGEGYALDLRNAEHWEKATTRHVSLVRTAVEKRARARGFDVQFLAVTRDGVYLGIIEAARKLKCDLIVMASHGRRGLSAVLLGSETSKVLTHTKIPVLVCR